MRPRSRGDSPKLSYNTERHTRVEYPSVVFVLPSAQVLIEASFGCMHRIYFSLNITVCVVHAQVGVES